MQKSLFSISEKVCDVALFDSIVPLDESNQFYLHLFGGAASAFHTLIVRIENKNNESRLGFLYRNCSDFNSKWDVDVYGNCDQTTVLSLQKGTWNTIHVTIQRSANVGKFGAIKRSDHCPYSEDVHCIIIEIQEKPFMLRLWARASVNCISGKISCFYSKS